MREQHFANWEEFAVEVTGRRMRALGAVVVLAAALLVALPGVAQARCGGQGVLVHSRLLVNDEDYVIERPRSSTCDGNNFYAAEIQSVKPGWRATVFVLNDGEWRREAQGIYNSAVVPYSHSYANDDSRSRMVLCADNGTTFHCGFGSNVRTGGSFIRTIDNSGVNSGY